MKPIPQGHPDTANGVSYWGTSEPDSTQSRRKLANSVTIFSNPVKKRYRATGCDLACHACSKLTWHDDYFFFCFFFKNKFGEWLEYENYNQTVWFSLRHMIGSAGRLEPITHRSENNGRGYTLTFKWSFIYKVTYKVF